MTVTVQIPDELATRLQLESMRRGVTIDKTLAQIIEERLIVPVGEKNALSEMFAQWNREDATDDPAEIARRQQEWEELKKALDDNRTSGRKLFSEQGQ